MAIADAARGQSGKLQARLRKLMGKTRAYRRLLFDADMNLKPEAREVLADLAEVAGIGRASPVLDHEYLVELEGRRRMFLHIMGRCNLPEAEARLLERDIERMEE